MSIKCRISVIKWLVVTTALVLVASIACYASEKNVESWGEHVDLMNIIIGGLFLAVIWFVVRSLKQIDCNQSELFRRHNSLEARFNVLQGEHNAIAEKCREGK